MADTDKSAPSKPEPSRLGQFIQSYSSFLSSFVIGVAGLVATSIWQYRQSEITRAQAASDQAITKAKADNEWRIARADILAKNLDVLSAQGENNTDRKFGVLLSLTRADILDPELAVSYALELGKENASYMRTVLANTHKKNYLQLAQAYELTCIERYGVEKDAEVCKGDKLSDRSEAISALIEDELMGTVNTKEAKAGPMSLLLNEDEVQAMPSKLAWLFEPYLQDTYEHRRWRDIEKFEAFSPGARLVSALVLATARTGELVSEAEAKQIDAFHTARRKWLSTYMLGSSCNAECRSRLVDFMLSTVLESDGDYTDTLKDLLLRPRHEVSRAVNQIHARLLWCQIDARDQALLRDSVMVPAATEVLSNPKHAAHRDPTIVEDLVALVALLPPPVESPAPDAGAVPTTMPAPAAGALAPVAAWDKVRDLIKGNPTWERTFSTRFGRAQRQRVRPPGMMKKFNFCTAAATDGSDISAGTPPPPR
ncbi:MAG: hypothetical protein SF187_21675 [Deltaproteobacteria bacterium]|nr:hypothetical protein [Deltaproteobacteria bacterium]